MKALLVLFSLSFTVGLFGQNINFIKSFGNNGYDFGRDIKQDIDTGYIATGSSSSFSSANADAFLLKIDSLGTFKWSYNYGGSGSDWGEAVSLTSDGGYSIAGYTNSFGAGGFDFYFIKTASDGSPQYEKTYGGSDWDKAYDMVQLPDDGFVLVGETFSYGEGNNDIYIVRIDASGDTLWTRTYGGPEADYANAVLLDGDSLVVVGGTESFGNGMSDGIILKYHINGTLGWMKTAGQEREDYFTGVAYHSNTGEYTMCGTRDYNHFQNCDCQNDFWIYKTNPAGIVAVDTSRPGADQLGIDIAYDVVIGDVNNTYFAGSTTSWASADIAQGFTDAFVGKALTTYAPTNFVKNFGNTKNDVAYGIDNTNDRGKVIIGDMYHNSIGGYNMFILKVDRLNTQGQIAVSEDLVSDVITLSIETQNSNQTISVNPTLVTNYVKIENLPTKNTVKIYNINGQQPIPSIVNSSEPIDLSSLPLGFYIVQIEVNAAFYNFKIIKQ